LLFRKEKADNLLAPEKDPNPFFFKRTSGRREGREKKSLPPKGVKGGGEKILLPGEVSLIFHNPREEERGGR